jgi:energy-coupling factor transporter ATP-binding protein EcfA2
MSEPIDAAFDRFKLLRPEINSYSESIETEEDTRLKVINRVMNEVLNWPIAHIHTEVHTGSGFADYTMSVGDRTRLILEAKRDGRDLGCSGRNAGRGYKLSGGVFNTEAAKEGIDQAIKYCGEEGCELACVTNGREWIVFRGSRLADGKRLRDGMAFVFPDLKAVEDNFSLFYDLLSYESAGAFGYRPYFHEAEGQPIRMSVFHKSVRPRGSARLINANQLYADLERVMGQYFQRLIGEGNDEMLEACFVESRESQRAERQLARIAEDVVTRIRDLDTGQGAELVRVIEATGALRRHEFVVIVGTKGAGKSTFIARFFSTILPKRVAENVVVVRTDLSKQTGDYGTLVQWLNRQLIEQIERALFKGAPTYAEIQGMFFDEYKRLMTGSWRTIYETNKDEFHQRFGDHIESWRASRSTDYIAGLLRHTINMRQELPILVLDNADHFDIQYQQRVYQYARSIYEQALCLVILPITDRTSWQLSKEGAFQSFENETFYLPAPKTEDVIRKRIEYFSSLVEMEKTAPDDRYAITRNLSITLDDLSQFARTLQQVFLQDTTISRWIGELANFNVRRTLDLAKALVSSPHMKVEDLVSAYLAGTAVEVPEFRAVNALIKQKYDIYPVSQNEYVQNVYALNEDVATSPLLGLRILQLLSDVPRDERRAALLNVDDLVTYCAGMNIDSRVSYLWLQALLDAQLVMNYDPTVTDIKDATQVEISPSGRLHLFWAQGSYDYLAAMSLVTPLLTESTFVAIGDGLRRPQDWRKTTALFVDYLVEEDRTYCLLPKHEGYQSQVRLTTALERCADRLRRPPQGKRRPSIRRKPTSA